MGEAETGTEDNVAVRLGFKEGDLVQEFGYDEDIDFDLRADVEDLIGSDLIEEDDHEVVDAVLLWHRSDDGDLGDVLMDVVTSLEDGGVIWVLSPKSGRDGYLPPAEIQEAAPTAGLHVTSSVGVSDDWAATRLVPRKNK